MVKIKLARELSQIIPVFGIVKQCKSLFYKKKKKTKQIQHREAEEIHFHTLLCAFAPGNTNEMANC